ncbi:MAG: transglutaminase domain-containing protein [Proteobacteria bacterium]|nr:transglutaminase domain-containing protein [Pseudomonadota bacterium]
MKESVWVQIVKTMLLALSAFGYTWPLIDGSGHFIVILAVIAASVLASVCARFRVRLIWCVLVSLILMVLGVLGSYSVLNVFGAWDMATTIRHSRFWYYMGIVFGIVFFSRSLALRYRVAQVIELSLLIGTLVYLFFAHRDFNLQNPREFADMLYTNGYDPIEVYRWMGIAAAFLALPMLFGRTSPGRAIYSIFFLVVMALLAANFLSDTRLPVNLKDPLGIMDKLGDDNEAGSDQDDNDNGGSSGDNENDDSNGGGSDDNDENNNNSGNKDDNQSSGKSSNNNQGPTGNESPTPVAIAVFYDEYTPTDNIFHFRQSVLSKYDGNHLVASTMDDDVISTLSTTNELVANTVQNPALHKDIATSMFLIEDHSQPPQLAMGKRIFPIQNPDPKLFVASYGVESQGLTVDITRLIGRHSIPSSWSTDKAEHYLQIPDDPRYQALSDIIVRQIDPRFVGDDIVKAIYIKSWLEENGYYTMKTKHIDPNDPTASFLFGSLRGYCVHFAHAAVFLLRSQGIAARVALGYAIDNQLRGTGSAVLILGNQAHAWPEIYVDGVGWVTLEIFPRNGDEPPRAFVDKDLESLFGELARDDKSGGKGAEPTSVTFDIPWRTVWECLLGLLVAALLVCYLRKVWILIRARQCRRPGEIYRVLRGVVFMWAMFGHPWRRYLTLESFAHETLDEGSATAQLIELTSAAQMGAELTEQDAARALKLLPMAYKEARTHTKVWRRILGWLNPIVRY